MNNKLRIAIIGFGKMGRHHFAAINAASDAAVVAVVDSDPEALSSMGDTVENVQLFSDATDMLQSVRPDVVHIVTPPVTHAELAKLSLNNGAHVYVEKPFALSASDATEVIELAAKLGKSVCPAHQVLFQRSGRKYREKLPLIGQVLMAESYFSFRPVRRSATGTGSVNPIDQLIDILPHPVYLLLDGLGAGDDSEQKLEIQNINVSAFGDVHAILRRGSRTGVLIVTLRGRPVESYLKIVGTNGSINADFVLSGVTTLPGPGVSAVSQIMMPFSHGWQRMTGTIASVSRIIFKRQGSYAGLQELFEKYYAGIRNRGELPISNEALLDTVKICEQIGDQLLLESSRAEELATEELRKLEKLVSPVDPGKEVLLVTGGTGFLGRTFVKLARANGFPVRVISRQSPSSRDRIPGVDYAQANLAMPLGDDLFEGVGHVIHLAAETAGGKDAHEKNSIQATQNLIDGCKKNGIMRLINIGSVAVMKSSAELGHALDESSPVDSDNLGRGPYVWGKAKAEQLVNDLPEDGDLEGKTIRLGPLVDFDEYVPPGRLGREMGNFFIAMGNPWNRVPICSVATAAKVILYYAKQFEQVPDLLNLVEPDSPKRSELWKLHKAKRPELTAIWMFKPVLIAISATLKVVLKILKPGRDPLDVYAAFSSEEYNTSLAKSVIVDADRSGI